jgi:hypothetical protein
MPILIPPNDPPQTEAGTLLYKIGREWCMGDTLKVFNNNFTNLDTRLDSVSTNLFAGLSSHVFKFNVVNTPTINLNYSTSLNRISADVIDGSINTTKLGGNILQAGKALLTAVNLSALQDVLITTTPTNGQLLQWNGSKWINATVSTGGGGGGTTTTGYLDPFYFNYLGSTDPNLPDQFAAGFDIFVQSPSNINNYPSFQDSFSFQGLTIKDGAVRTAKIADSNVTPNKLSPGRPVWDTNSNVAIGGTVPSSPSRLTVFGNISATGTITGNFNEILLSTRAGSLTGGTAGQVPYQTGTGSTAFISVGTSGQFLRSNGSSAPSWSDVTGLTVNAATSALYANSLKVYDAIGNPISPVKINRIVYQKDNANDGTKFLDTGTLNQFLCLTLDSSYGGLPYYIPTWVSINLNAVPNLATPTSYNTTTAPNRIPYTTGLSAISFTDQPLGENYVLRTDGTRKPTWVTQASLAAGTADSLKFATSATRKGGVVYVTADIAATNTANIEVATTNVGGYLLASGTPSGTGVPTWKNPVDITVGNATSSTNAGTATNVATSGTGLLYNSGTPATTKTDIGLTVSPTGGDVLVSQGTGLSPAWKDPATTITAKEAKAPTASFTLAADKITGILGIGFGGTGATDAAGVRAALSLATSNAVTFGNITANGTITATGDITAFSSDKRLKENFLQINKALDKVNSLTGFTYNFNELAKSFGFDKNIKQVGVFAQDIQNVLPEAVKPAPFDTEEKNGEIVSKSGENYLTVQYEKIVPLLIEAIKELSQEVKDLKSKIKE